MRTVAEDVQIINRIPVVPTILDVMARLTGMRFTAVARVTDTHWTACAVRDEIAFGLKPGGELKLETTICDEIRQHGQAVIFGSARASPLYREHPTPKMYGFESYVSIPIIRSDGSFFGTLCAIDPAPAKLDDPALLRTLELFAQLIATHLDTHDLLETRTTALAAAHDAARLRDQLVAVLGHDLRNPLQSISVSAHVIERMPGMGAAHELAQTIQRSARRMSGLIEDILDFARGKLGGGIPVTLAPAPDLEGELRQVIGEVAATHPGRTLDTTFALGHPVTCDSQRLAQLFGNLLLNAMVHGSPAHPVTATARSDEHGLELSVGNGGAVIPAGVIDRLFEPFARGAATQSRNGLGLGLYIAAAVARAHHGAIEVSSSADSGTRFTFRMPRLPG